MVRVLVIAAHPDDEVLGCGGTIARHVAEGDKVGVLILGEGVTSRDIVRDEGRNSVQLGALRKSAKAAADILGVKEVIFENLPDNRFDSMDLLDVIKKVESVKEIVQPDIVYTHHGSDLNIDHRVTHQAVVTAFRPLPCERLKAVYTFEVSSSTEWQLDDGKRFHPNHYVDISDYLEKKTAALACYAEEMCDFPHPRSISAVEYAARLAGTHIGVQAAERFKSLWTIYVNNK